MTMKKLTLQEIEKFILENKDSISKLDEKHLPEVIAELQAEQAFIDGVEDHRTITEISREACEEVLHCWGYTDEGERILDAAFAE